MHQIVLLIKSTQDKWLKNTELGNLFMNRFAIEEDANFEIFKIIYLEDDFGYINYDKEKGKGLMI